MVSWIVKDFGGTIPRRDPRLLDPNMGEEAVNVDLAAGPLDALPQPQFIVDLTNQAPYPVRRAYRFPGPTATDPDVWLPLPSEYSSVCRSPLANDTLHRIYWTNPPTAPAAGAYWNTYARIAAGNIGSNAPYNMGFIGPDLSLTLTVTTSGGTIPVQSTNGASVEVPGTGYAPGSNLTVTGGTLQAGASAYKVKISTTQATNLAIVSRGSGGTDGSNIFVGTTGNGSRLQFWGTVAGGQLASIDSIISGGAYTSNPTNIYNEPISGSGLTGAAISMQMGALELQDVTASIYTTAPDNPAATTCDGAGSGCTVNVHYVSNNAPPLLTRSYCFTYVDQYGEESSPCTPSDTVDGPSDATWTIAGLPTSPPANPAGKNYPTVTKLRLYRTITGTSTGAQFFMVADINFGSTSYADSAPDSSIVNNNLLESTSWAPPVDQLDGLTAMTGGMLIGFTGNTIHFCEPDRPHAWPAGYDQSLLYTIVALAVWQQSLVVLTTGFPSIGAGNSPSQIMFQQLQAPEPCISRGSVITDLAGVYYASQNGLIMLSYFGMTNQTLSNLTRSIWLTDFHAKNLVACRHRAAYLAINGTGSGFIIDYTEQRMGIVTLNTFLDAVAVWNDVYTGDAYICADQRIYLWDAPSGHPTFGVTTIVQCSFTAADNTRLEDYNNPSDLGASFLHLGGNEIMVEGNAMAPPVGTGAYKCVSLPPTPDYTIKFSVQLPGNANESVWVAGRAQGVDTGYQAAFAIDAVGNYVLSLTVLSPTSPRPMPMIVSDLAADARLDITLSMTGSDISVSATRSSDGFYLRVDGAWVDTAVAAITIVDTSYTLPGMITIGGSS